MNSRFCPALGTALARRVPLVVVDVHVDLLLTDMIMPGGLNGYDLAKKATKLYPNLKVLFTSGFPETAFGERCVLPDGELLLSKPYRKNELAAKLKEVLECNLTF